MENATAQFVGMDTKIERIHKFSSKIKTTQESLKPLQLLPTPSLF